MSTKTKKLTLRFCILLFLFSVGTVFAQVPDTYYPLSALPVSNTDGSVSVDLDDPGSYFNNLLALFISIAAILGVIKLMICGFQYMTSEAISSKEEAKKCIWYVLGGLFLILLSVLILQTINKDLIKIPFETIQQNIQKGTPTDTTFTPSSVDARSCYINATGEKQIHAGLKQCNTALNAARKGSTVGLESASCGAANCATNDNPLTIPVATTQCPSNFTCHIQVDRLNTVLKAGKASGKTDQEINVLSPQQKADLVRNYLKPQCDAKGGRLTGVSAGTINRSGTINCVTPE